MIERKMGERQERGKEEEDKKETGRMGRNKKNSRRIKGEGEKEETVLISFAPTSELWRRH